MVIITPYNFYSLLTRDTCILYTPYVNYTVNRSVSYRSAVYLPSYHEDSMGVALGGFFPFL